MTADFALWQWSLLAQGVSSALIASFFVAFRQSMPSPAVTAWTRSWLANAVALLVSIIDVYWIDATSGPVFALVCALYLLARAVGMLWLIDGVVAAANAESLRAPQRIRVVALSAVGIAAVTIVRTFVDLGLFAQVLVCTGAIAGLLALRDRTEPALTWLGIGLAARIALSGIEIVAYLMELWPSLAPAADTQALFARLLAVSSSFDALGDWLVALGCVIAATGHARAALMERNASLRQVHDTLRSLVDLDALTGLANRRALAGILATARATGATLAFIDLRGFKDVNDALGHAAGDALLRRLAAVLRDCFRPEDHVTRYAGDEFVIVAQGLTRDAMHERIQAVRVRMDAASESRHRVQFDVGLAQMLPGDDPDEALRLADLSMYEAKTMAKHAPERT
jgi:diguanylate cyclase (GGDEF)-like protein